MTDSIAEIPRGPVRASERAIAPDLTRGLMLLPIVLSNTTVFLWATPSDGVGVYPAASGWTDNVVQTLLIVTLDVRVYPLFAFLFGYGMTQVFLRQQSAGSRADAAVGPLRRRGCWLLVFGFCHAALLLPTDVLGAYGVLSLLLSWLFLRRRDRTLLAWSAVGAGALALMFIAGGALTYLTAIAAFPAETAGDTNLAPLTGAETDDYLASIGLRLVAWAGTSTLTIAGITAPVAMILGMWAARRRILEEPANHLRLLRWTAVVGIAIGWLGALPAALVELGWLRLPPADGMEFLAPLMMQWPTGLAGGVGYVALFALFALRIAGRPTPGAAVTAVMAVGKRSLSCYLTHSLLMAPTLAAWGLGWGAALNSTTMALFAVGVWLITVIGCYGLERGQYRHPILEKGPAEMLLRRLTYGPRRG